MSRALTLTLLVLGFSLVVFANNDPCPTPPPEKSCFDCTDASGQNNWWCPETLQCFKSSDDCDHGCKGGNCVASSSSCPTYCGCCVAASGSFCSTANNATGFCFDNDSDCQKGCVSTCVDSQSNCPAPSGIAAILKLPTESMLKTVRGKSAVHIRNDITKVAVKAKAVPKPIHPLRKPSPFPLSCKQCTNAQQAWCPSSSACFDTVRDCGAGCSQGPCITLLSQCPTQCSECLTGASTPTAWCGSQDYCYDYASDCQMGTCANGCTTNIASCPAPNATETVTVRGH